MQVADVPRDVLSKCPAREVVHRRAEPLDESLVTDESTVDHRADVVLVGRVEPFQLAHHHVDDVKNVDLEVKQRRIEFSHRLKFRDLRKEGDTVPHELEIEMALGVKNGSLAGNLQQALLHLFAVVGEDVAVVRAPPVIRLEHERCRADEPEGDLLGWRHPAFVELAKELLE